MMQASGGGGGGGGGAPMNPAQLARLQQQLAQQYGQLSGQQQQQNPMMSNVNVVNAMGGGAATLQQQQQQTQQQQQQQQLQQAYLQQQQLQQQQQQQQQQPVGGMGNMGQRRSSLQVAGMGGSAALAMMQQQQQQQGGGAGNSQMANTYWNALQGGGGGGGGGGVTGQNPVQGGGGGTMDASSATSGAQLAAMAGMNVVGQAGVVNSNNPSMMGPNSNVAANMLLGSRSNNPGQNMAMTQQGMQGMGVVGPGGMMGGGPASMQGGGVIPGLGQTTDASILQQQIAQLQRQLQQQQQQQQQSNQAQNPMAAMQGMTGMDRQTSVSSTGSGNFQQQHQQQQQQQQNPLFQQMQQLSGAMLGQGNSSASLSQQRGSMGGGGGVGIANDQFSMLMQGQNQQQQQQQMNSIQNLRDSMGGSSSANLMGGGVGSQGGRLNEQELLMQQQQQQLLRRSGLAQGVQGDAQKVQEMFRQQQLQQQQQQQQNPHADLMGRRSTVQQNMDQQGLASSMNSQSQHRQVSNMTPVGGGVGPGAFNTVSPYDMDGSMSSQRSNRQSMLGGPNILANPNDAASGVGGGRGVLGDNSKSDDQGNKSFLDGSFAGGWQSNADLPDRRRIIFAILDVIRQMRTDTNKISEKLPHMAKSLEEHLYRSAQTKEQYLDQSTLKKRLQLIAHGLEVHRSTSSGSVQSNSSAYSNQGMHEGSGGGGPTESQQLQQFLQMQQGNMVSSGSGGSNNSVNQGGIPSMIGSSDSIGGIGGQQNNMQPVDVLQGLVSGFGSGSGVDGNEPMSDRIAAQKKKVIRQQQQRLLLLRHASKCKLGPACQTKFCGQMTTLWKHMKKCRDKNCKTSHCLSSRCVLNHYRICKSQGRTAACEVCGPVMEQIKRQDASEGLDGGSDPLAAKPDPDLPSQFGVGFDRQLSIFGQADVQQNAQVSQQQVMQQLYQQQQQAIQQNQQGSDMSAMLGDQMQQSSNTMQSQGGGAMLGNRILQGDESSGSQHSTQPNDQQQLQQLQNAQQKLHQQQQVLKQLQKQQAQLLEQQRQLQEQQQQGQQGQQLQQQHALLQQLQRRCQQQQALIQQELMLTMKGIQQQQQSMQAGQNIGSQLLSNNSQQSQLGQNSTGSQNHIQGILGNQNIQGNQVLPLVQGSSQSHLQSFTDNSQSNVGMLQVQSQLQNQLQMQMQNQMMQNQMHNQSQLMGLDSSVVGNQDSLLLLNNQGLDDDKDDVDDDGSDQLDAGDPNEVPLSEEKVEPSKDDKQSESEDEPSEQQEKVDKKKPVESISLPLNDNSDRSSGSKSKRRTLPKVSPAGGRGMGPRGRGGKGKRLREIADDLMAVSGEGSASFRSDAEAVAQSVVSAKKRTADEISGDLEGEQSSKSAKTDGPSPDTERSGGNKEGEGDASLGSSLPKGDVEEHLLMLHKGLHLTSRTITHKCLPIVQQLIEDPYGWVFRDAVDPVVFGLPDYFEVVKNPMHLLLVKKKLENAVYTDMASFERDVKLVFENAILYNGEESEVGQLAHTMMGVFEKEYKKVCEELNDAITIDQKACKLCGAGCLQLEPPVLYCSGMSCGMSRIKRNAMYYTDAKNQNSWCKACYSQLASQDLILLDDGSEISKLKLLSAKHDSLPEESFLECHDCKGRVHQVCALVNGRKVKSREIFRCPKCILVHRSAENEPPKPTKESAKHLPRCKMSDSMEEGLLRTLDLAYEKVAAEMGIDVSEVEKAEGLSIRVMSHVQKQHAVRDEMYNKYSKHGCPASFPVHTKCVGLFQSIFGVDVLLFAMYVYEYGQDSPAPNRRRVYISYLDSVKYFEPKRYRTVAYQAVIIEYLRFVKRRGFHTAHIWSCPPAPGDEYVFHCHPSHQKVPKESMLRQWYYDTLKEAQRDGIVVETTELYEEYFKNGGANSPLGAAPDPMSLPYFEGDYIPGEIENIVANVNKEEKGGKQPVYKDMVVPSFSKRTTSGLRSGTRSNPGQLVNQVQDKVMNRLGIAIYNMKDNLIIARLRSKRFAAAVERGDDVSAWPDDDDESRPESLGKDSSSLRGRTRTQKEESQSGDDDDDEVVVDSQGDGMDEIAPALARHFATLEQSDGSRIGSTVDEDDEFESEMFESRQLFLNYCQTNHLQFDELRRAKHTTMMVLYQLHNPSAPKFVPRCGACQRDIGGGSSRYHCVMCANFDLCEGCYRPVVSGAWSHRSSRFRHDSTHTFSRIGAADPSKRDGTGPSQDQRTKALQAYLEVLTHAARCGGPPQCRLQNCAKMKHLFVHVTTCETTHSGGCRICARLLALIVVHARSCNVRGGSCPLPYCDKIRERNERLRRQQLFMDDRRRQAQNAIYRAGEA